MQLKADMGTGGMALVPAGKAKWKSNGPRISNIAKQLSREPGPFAFDGLISP